MYNWGYSEDDGLAPDQWASYYQSAGKHQSPINILVKNYEQIIGSTCCSFDTTRRARQATRSSSPGHHQAQVDKLRGVLRRSHLDSIGEDNHHSSSASSSASGSTSSSPTQREVGDDDSDGSEIGLEGRRTKERSDNGSRANYLRQKQLGGLEGPQSKAAAQVQAQNTRHCTSNKKLFLGYPRYLSSMQLCNTGHGWQVNLPAELSTHTILTGPPLGDREYRLAQLHCHWGEDCNQGSEHQINGRSFSAEIHFVHWNCTHFNSMEEASRHKHGLAVLAVFVQALDGHQNKNKHLEKIVGGLKLVQEAGSSATIQSRLDLKKLFPANRWVYATYEGSLTTPPLSEVVDWIVFLNPIQCSTEQIEQFRQIRCPSSGGQKLLNKNHRPVQPLNNRLLSIWTHH